MIARSFRSVGWVAGVGAAALGCYMLSLQVAAERAELASVERRIVAARQAIRSLQTELGTRGRLQQLEHWNAEVLALSAPVAGQFMDSPVTLARLEVREPGLDERAQVRLASADTSAAQPAQPAPQRAVVADAPAPAAQAEPLVRRASIATEPTLPGAASARPAEVRRASLATEPRTAAAPAATRRETVRPRREAEPRSAAREESRRPLIDSGTLTEIGAAERAERDGKAPARR